MACGKGCCKTQREHWLSIGISANALPTRKKAVRAINNTEATWDKDMPAYKRMRGAGLQPKSIDGAAEIESKATDPMEVEMGRLMTAGEKETLKAVKEGTV